MIFDDNSNTQFNRELTVKANNDHNSLCCKNFMRMEKYANDYIYETAPPFFINCFAKC